MVEMNYNLGQIHEKVSKQELDIKQALKLIKQLDMYTGKRNVPKSQISRLFVYNEPFLKDHTVFEKQVLLGVTYCSLAIEAARKIFPERNLSRIHKVLFDHPIILDENESAKVKVIVEEGEKQTSFKCLYKKSTAKSYLQAASGELDFNPIKSHERIDLSKYKKNRSRTIPEAEIYKNIQGVKHGPSLRTVKGVHVCNQETLGELELTPVMQAWGSRFFLHPALLDGAVVSGTVDLSYDDSPPFVPFFIKEICLHDSISNHCFCYSRLIKNEKGLAEVDLKLCDEKGHVCVSLKGFSFKSVPRTEQFLGKAREAKSPIATEESVNSSTSSTSESVKDYIEEYLASKIAKVIGIQSNQLDRKLNFMDLGVDSTQLISFSKEIEKEIEIELYPTLFFEHQNICELCEFFENEHVESFIDFLGISSVKSQSKEADYGSSDEIPITSSISFEEKITNNEIAIIGMAGIFPDSPNVLAFWENLRNKKNLIKEIPPDHFDYSPWFDTDFKNKKMYCKWGSFIDEVDVFDASFFNISPREAEFMDPQLRQLLQVLYTTMEDAGRVQNIRGSKTGMYLGVCFSDYREEMIRLGIESPYIGTGNAATMMSNRPSFSFDLQGPSITVDTACSSSLVALHLACKALQNNECKMAFAAATNLLMSANHYKLFCSLGALSPSGRCHTFDKQADGYVPGECVAAVLLKPLKAALQNNDRIHAVIKGSAINHGGYTNSITAPSTKLETQVIVDSWKNSQIDPETIGYIEAHGTGTKLGDPIEVEALKKAFKQFTKKQNYCALGSAKAHIGHTESAAGIAGIIKVVLSMKNREIPAMPMFNELNPLIKLDASPLYINRNVEKWERINNAPLRAGVSSFGFGGAYAHVVVEEYEQVPPSVNTYQDDAIRQSEFIFLISAKNQEQLQTYVSEFIIFLEEEQKQKGRENSIEDITFTSQIGREAMAHRLAMVVANTTDLKKKLVRYSLGELQVEGLYRGSADENNLDSNSTLRGNKAKSQVKELSITEIAKLWVSGAAVDWYQLYPDRRPRLVSLATYPFAKAHFPMPKPDQSKRSINTPGAIKLHPFINSNCSTLDGMKFQYRFTGSELYLSEHQVNDQMILPGVVTIEIARAAAEIAGKKKIHKLRDNMWMSPLIFDGRPYDIDIMLHLNDEILEYSVRKTSEEDIDVIHLQGRAFFENSLQEYPLTHELFDIATFQSNCNKIIKADDLYRQILDRGLYLGESLKSIQTLYYNGYQALSVLKLPDKNEHNFTQLPLHPAIMDGAMQTVGWLCNIANENDIPSLPFALGEVEIIADLSETCFCYVAPNPDQNRSEFNKSYNISILDDRGSALVKLNDVTFRQFKPISQQIEAAIQSTTMFFDLAWQESEIPQLDQRLEGTILIFANENSDLSPLLEEKAGSAGLRFIRIKPGHDFRHLDANTYELDLLRKEDFDLLFSELSERNLYPDNIIYFGLNDEITDKRNIDDQLNQGLYNVIRLSQSLITNSLKREIGLLYLYSLSSQSLTSQSLNTAFSGFAKAIRKENQKFLYKTVAYDLEALNSTTLDLSAQILSELIINDGTEVHYSDDKRYLRQLKEFDIKEKIDPNNPLNPAKTELKEKGVYLITGGLGGLGLIFARFLAQQIKARLLLVGRSVLNDANQKAIRELESMGAEVCYMKADVSDRVEVQRLISQTKHRFGTINGIIHSAGIIQDGLLTNKSPKEITKVLAPKIHGTVYLDEETKDEALDFFILFSSITSIIGNIGQCDYAFANAFLDAFAENRERYQAKGKRKGKTLSINWPLWKDGGMRVNAETEKMIIASTGMNPMSSAVGIDAFRFGLLIDRNQFLVVEGYKEKVIQSLNIVTKDVVQHPIDIISDSFIEFDEQPLVESIQNELLRLASEIIKVPVVEISLDTNLLELGFESISIAEFSNKITEIYQLNLTATVFFEFETPTIKSLSEYLYTEHKDYFLRFHQKQTKSENKKEVLFESSPKSSSRIQRDADSRNISRHNKKTDSTTDIAIIGMSGIMPQSADLDEFWLNIESGSNLISETPSERWDWEKMGGDSNIGRWGGFLKEVDKFDPLFFGISPREAETMDPQQRIFLETVWKTIEDAGYKPSDLSGTNTGLFVGIASSDYAEIAKKSPFGYEGHSATGIAHSISANRISYLLNIYGPSEPIDTACSSSLVAINRGVRAIRSGECELVIAGGVNIILSPEIIFAFHAAGMISSTGKCKSFDKDADGFIRGEGSGAILMKPFDKALKDRDHIYAIIKGSAVNHNGKGASLTAPNAGGQARVLIDAYRSARVDISTIGYIEAMAAGSKLGDAIEIAGLEKAYKELNSSKKLSESNHARCGIGSVKSNIGHLETASGIAGVFKVLLSLKNKTLPTSVHFNELNPHIQLDKSPFYIVNKTQYWKPLTDKMNHNLPRRAGVSSFGFGGINAHLILEEYEDKSSPANTHPDQQSNIIILSAKNDDRLTAYVESMIQFLSGERPKKDGIELLDMAYTLQTGREAMESRLAIVTYSLDDIKDKLIDFKNGNGEGDEFIFSSQKNSVMELNRDAHKNDANQVSGFRDSVDTLIKLAKDWVQGKSLDWQSLYPGRKPKRLSLPSYPFARERYWIDVAETHKELAPAIAQSGQTNREFQKISPPIDSHESEKISSFQPREYRTKTDLTRIVQSDLLKEISTVIRLDKNLIDINDMLSDFGFDSIMLTELAKRISEKYEITLDSSLFLELDYPSINKFSEYLCDHHAESCFKYYNREIKNGDNLNESGEIPQQIDVTEMGPEMTDKVQQNRRKMVKEIVIRFISKIYINVSPYETIDDSADLVEFNIKAKHINKLLRFINREFKTDTTKTELKKIKKISQLIDYLEPHYKTS